MAIWAAGLTGLGALGSSFLNEPGETGYVMPGFQKKTGKAMQRFIEPLIGQGLAAYPGALTAGMSPYEELGLSKLLNYGEQPNQTQKLGIETYQNLLKGMTPEEAEAFYMKHYDPMEQRYMQQEIIPGFKESLVPGGNLRSSGMDLGLGNIWGEMGVNRMRNIGDLYKWSQEMAGKMIPYTGQFTEIEGGMPQIEALMQYGAVPRNINQEDINRKVDQFYKTMPELSPTLDKALGLLGVSPGSAYYQEGSQHPLNQLFTGLMPGVSYGLGQYLARPRQSTQVNRTISPRVGDPFTPQLPG